MSPRTSADVADLFHVKAATVNRWASEGKLTGVKVGRLWFFEQADIDVYVKARRVATEKATTSRKRRRRAT